MKISTLALTALVFTLGIMLVLPVMAQQTAPSGNVGVAVTIGPVVKDMAKNPKPPANAQQKTSVGKSGAAVGTQNSSDDTDSFWAQEIDVDGDGNVEKADILWDDEDKALFIAYDDTFTCKNGGTGTGSVLIGLNAEGNARKMPAGSGFYAVSLDKGECGSESAGIWGCKFDANGNATACGVAIVDEKTDSLIIAKVSQ